MFTLLDTCVWCHLHRVVYEDCFTKCWTDKVRIQQHSKRIYNVQHINQHVFNDVKVT